MASQSWRQYGSINNNESSNSGYFNNLVVDNLTLRNHYNGFLNVNGTLSVTGGVTFNSTLSVTSDVLLNNNLTVNQTAFLNSKLIVTDLALFKNNVTVGGDLNIIGAFQFQNDIRSVGNLAAGGTSLILGFNKLNGVSTVNSNDVINGMIGLNTPTDIYRTLPGAALDVYSGVFDTNTTLNVFNGVSTSSQSVLISTLSEQKNNTNNATEYTPTTDEFLNTARNGIIAYTDTTSCSINFFTSQSQSIRTTTVKDGSDNYVTINPIVPTSGDLAITYMSPNKTLTIGGQQTAVIPSSIILGGKNNQTNFKETLSLFTNTQNSTTTALLPNYYDISTNMYSTWNTMTMVTPNVVGSRPYASTFMNLIDSKNQFGMKMGGGTYINDTTRSVGILGVTTDSNTNWTPSQMIVSGTNPAYCHSTTGINTFAPHTENYSLDVNGAVQITNGEIVLIQKNIPYDIQSIISCNTNRSIMMAMVSSSGIPYVDSANNTSYMLRNLFSLDGGIHWQVTNPYNNAAILNPKDGYIYDISCSVLSYDRAILVSTNKCVDWKLMNFGDAEYNIDGDISFGSTVKNSLNCVTSPIRIFKFKSPGVLLVFSGKDLTSNLTQTSPTNQHIYYGYLKEQTNIDKYTGGSAQYLYLTKFLIDISYANTIDGYDTSYLFVAGSTGIYKYGINTSYCDDFMNNGGEDGCNQWAPEKAYDRIDSTGFAIKKFRPKETIIKKELKNYNVKKHTYNKMQTYKSYDSSGNLLPDPYFSVFVGNGIITSTLDGGQSFYDVSFTDTSFNSVYIHDSRQAIATTNNGIIYTTHDGGITWTYALNEFNLAGTATKTLMNPTCNLTSVCMSSSNDLIISRLDVSYNTLKSNIPSTNLYFCHLPSLFNRQFSSILDICGSMCTYGYSYVQNNMTVGNNTIIGGSIAVNSGSVLIKQGSYNPSGTTGIGATLVVNGGVGIAGNTIIGNNLTVNNTTYLSSISSITPGGGLTLSTGSGNIDIGSYSTVFTNYTNNINIGTTNDNITLFGTVTSNGALTTSSDKISVFINVPLPQIQKNAGITIGGRMDKSTAYNGYLMTDTNNLGILLKAPNSNNSVDIFLDSMTLNTNITRGILTMASLQNYKKTNQYSGLDQYDPSYIISSCPNIDISNLILSTNINSINNVQTLNTSVAINGNLRVSDGNVLINQISISSSSTSTGAIVVSGGIGVSGNINTSGYVKITNTDPYALSVSGGMLLGGNLLASGNVSCANTNISGDIVVKKNSYVSGQSFINVFNGIDNIPSYQTLLSMTDFSYNATFYSTSDAYNTTSGTVKVIGGVGIGGNVFVGGNTTIMNNTPSNSTNSGALRVVGGAGIGGNVFVGGYTIISGKIPSNSTNSGVLQVVGGAGISGNVFVGGNTVILGNIPSNSTNSGVLQVVGGAGISGNVFVGGNTVILGNTNSYSTNSGALQVVGGVGISRDLLIGGNITIGGLLNVTSAIPSVSCYTGVTMGGLGIQGNLYVNNQSYQGMNATLFSGLLLYYPFSTDISNYATGTPVTDMVLFPSTWENIYKKLTNQYGHMVGGPDGGAFDISRSDTNTNFLISTFSPTQIQNLTQFTVSFWTSIQNFPPSGSIGLRAHLFDFNLTNLTGTNRTNSNLYAYLESDGRIFVSSDIGLIPQNLPGYRQYTNTNFTNNKTWNLFTFNCTIFPSDQNCYLIVKLYINGVLDNTCRIDYTSPSPFSTFNNFMIGYNNMGATNFHYLLNDFRLYNRVLDEKEIVQLYNSSGLATWNTDVRYDQTMILNSDTTTYTTIPSYKTVYTPISFPQNITTAISGNLAVSGLSNLRGNTLIMGDLNVTGYFLQNGTRLGYNVTDSSMIIAGPGGYFGGNLLIGNIYLNTLKLGTGGYFGGSTLNGDISLNRIKLGTGGYFGGSMTNGDISLNHINLGPGGYFGGNINSGDISLNHLVIGGSSASTSTNTGNLQVIGGVGIGGNINLGGNINVGGTTSTLTSGTLSTSTGTGTLVVTGGVGIGGNINVGGSTSTLTASTSSTSTGTGTLVVTGGVGIGGNINLGGNINVGGTTNTLTANTSSTTTGTGTLVVTGGVGIGGNINLGGNANVVGNINVSGAKSTYTAGTTSTSTGSGTLVVTGGVGISENICLGGNMNLSGNVNCSGAKSTYTAGTTSTSTGTGTLVVTGGVGISENICLGGNMNLGGNINCSGATSTLTTNTISTSTGTGTLVVTGGVGIGGNINVGGSTSKLTANTSSTSIGTGTLVVTGGVGIGESLFVKNTITTTNLTIAKVDTDNGILTINIGSKFVVNDTANDAVTVKGRGNFNSLYANGNTSSTTTGTGTLVVTGGVGISENVNVGGTVTVTSKVTAASFNATSDYRIKTSITDLDPTFTTDHLRPVKYTNIHDKKEYIGFIAHEIQQTYPYLVTGEKDGEETQTMNYDGIIGILVNEIKMLKQRICILENNTKTE